MTSLRRFAAHDLLQFNNVNLNYFTETVSGAQCPCGVGTATVLFHCRRRLPSLRPACTRTPAPHPTALPRCRLQYGLNFYLDYLAKWPEYCQMAVGPAQQAMGYSE